MLTDIDAEVIYKYIVGKEPGQIHITSQGTDGFAYYRVEHCKKVVGTCSLTMGRPFFVETEVNHEE